MKNRLLSRVFLMVQGRDALRAGSLGAVWLLLESGDTTPGVGASLQRKGSCRAGVSFLGQGLLHSRMLTWTVGEIEQIYDSRGGGGKDEGGRPCFLVRRFFIIRPWKVSGDEGSGRGCEACIQLDAQAAFLEEA